MSQLIHPFDIFMSSFLLCVQHLTTTLYLYIPFNIVCMKVAGVAAWNKRPYLTYAIS